MSTFYWPHDDRGFQRVQTQRNEKAQILHQSSQFAPLAPKGTAKSRIVTSLSAICRSYHSRRVLVDSRLSNAFPSWSQLGAQRRVQTGGNGNAGKVGCSASAVSTGDLLCSLCYWDLGTESPALSSAAGCYSTSRVALSPARQVHLPNLYI
jgi:hypothetical protein